MPVRPPRIALLCAVALAACTTVERGVDAPPPPAPTSEPSPETGPAETQGPASTPACVVSPTPAPFVDTPCAVPVPSTKDSFDEALAVVGKDRCSLGLDLDDVESGWSSARDPRAPAEFAPLLARPLRLPGYGAEIAKWLDDALDGELPVTHALVAAAARQGTVVAACPDAAIFAGASAETPLASALAVKPESLAAVPLELQRALVPIVRALAWADAEVKAAFGTTNPRDLEYAPDFAIGRNRSLLDAALLAKMDAVDIGRILRASVVVATVIEAAHLERFSGMAVPAVDVETGFGAIVLRGPDADEYGVGSKAANAAFVLDTGGDDTYLVPVAATTRGRFVSVAVDLAGSDRYAYVEKSTTDDPDPRLPNDGSLRTTDRTTMSRNGRQGSGVLGIGMLFDLAGNDTYSSLSRSQGAAAFGVGVLFDATGDDRYASEAFSQGASAWGLGLLLDRAGKDDYFGYSAVQGYASTRGVGILADHDGDDVYATDPGDPKLGGHPIYDSPQLPGVGNTSMAQGCSRGFRENGATPALPGGLGLLRDRRGNDRYATSVFGQASGYLLGIGLLLDGAGDDTYEGLWYVQGANAHTAISYFHDRSGNDRYNPTYPVTATSIGVGHDFSAALHLDEGGNDVYKAPGLCLGAGNKNGIGIFVNVGGDDSFTGNGVMMGAANSAEVLEIPARITMPTIGVFVKAGGSSTYAGAAPVGSGAGSGSTWSTTPNKDKGANEIAVGIDRPTGTATLP